MVIDKFERRRRPGRRARSALAHQRMLRGIGQSQLSVAKDAARFQPRQKLGRRRQPNSLRIAAAS